LGAYTAIELSRFQRVESRRATLVYAAGQRLVPGVNVRTIDLTGTLRRLKYKEVPAPVATPGQFRREADAWELYLKGAEDGGPTRLRLELEGERIARVLRERREDIPLLAEHFLAGASERCGRALRLTPTASARLPSYAWPGNVRELENAIERAAILANGEPITPDDLPQHIVSGTGLGPPPVLPAQQNLAEIERAHIVQTLERCGWNQSRAAEALGIGRSTLWRKFKDYGLDRTDAKDH
jgi:hypothetical protein